MGNDRKEMHDLSGEHPELVRQMHGDYRAWVHQVDVQTWPMPQTPCGSDRDGAMPSPNYLLKSRP